MEDAYIDFTGWVQWGEEQGVILPGNAALDRLAATHRELDDSMKLARYFVEQRYQELLADIIPQQQTKLRQVTDDQETLCTVLVGLDLDPPMIFKHPIHAVLKERLSRLCSQNSSLLDILLGAKEQEFDAHDGDDIDTYEEAFGRRLKEQSFVSRVRELSRVRSHILEMDDLAQSGRIPNWHPNYPVDWENYRST